MVDPLYSDAPASAPELYTVEDVADLLRLSVCAVRERAKKGQIPGVVEGMKPRRFRAAEVRRWLGLDPSPSREACEGEPPSELAGKVGA